jgi:hypothetical protein
MRVVESSQYPRRDLNPRIAAAADVPRQTLRATVDAISYPRHYVEQPRANARAAAWIEAELQSYGYQTERQGEFGNIVTTPRSDAPQILIGAHYDSKPNTPGADDNASAVAAMLAAAKAVSENGSDRPVMFVAFNREEEDLLGSQDFVRNFLPNSGLQLAQVHVLEMVGFSNAQPRSQRLPRGLPVRLVRDRGDFLALLGNNRSAFRSRGRRSAIRATAPARWDPKLRAKSSRAAGAK